MTRSRRSSRSTWIASPSWWDASITCSTTWAHPDAERVIVMMGSGVGAAEEAVTALVGRGEKVGLVKVRLYRPFAVEAFLRALPATVSSIAVLDRTKEPGAMGEPLYLDVVAALVEGWQAVHRGAMPQVIGGRYGLSSKEFTPAMVMAVYDELAKAKPKRHFTVGIFDDVTHLSLKYDAEFSTEADDVIRAVFYGLGSDGTVGASKNSVKIVGENTPMYAQGYFVYDSKKAGSMTVSHLRFSPRPIKSTYLISRASFVACHQFVFMETTDVLEMADPGATFLLNSPFTADEVWDKLPLEAQQQIIAKKLKFYVVDAVKVAQEAGMGGRINTVMQTCFFALSGILPRDEAIEQIKYAINKTYGKRGESILRKNFAAVDGALGEMRGSQGARRGHQHSSSGKRCRRKVPATSSNGDRGHLRRQGRSAAGQRHAGRRHVPDRHGQVREAEHCVGDSDLGSQHLHRLCHVRIRLPACGDSHQAVRTRGAGRRSRDVPIEGKPRQGLRRVPHDDPGRAGRLHRLRRVRGSLPGQEQGGRATSGDQHGAEDSITWQPNGRTSSSS